MSQIAEAANRLAPGQSARRAARVCPAAARFCSFARGKRLDNASACAWGQFLQVRIHRRLKLCSQDPVESSARCKLRILSNPKHFRP